MAAGNSVGCRGGGHCATGLIGSGVDGRSAAVGRRDVNGRGTVSRTKAQQVRAV
ncbi:hypothetical protein HPP92_026234 [Vanilla planifolia]|uniref:Uncharacterized protein n=1 Tax=Vanilla planifolia TaxID=51239 RepID=A0A835PE93_VANPL|nr:hypothetical protein HPP92_026234 [Vanilla planifolia]